MPAFGRARPAVPVLAQRLRAGLGGQIFLRLEVSVEASVGQSGHLHEVRYPDAVEAVFAEQPSGHLDDAVPVLLRPSSADLHSGTPDQPARPKVGLDTLYVDRHLFASRKMSGACR